MTGQKKPDGKPNGKGELRGRLRKTFLRTLCPVPDLEEHVQADWWSKIFNSMYLKTDGDVVEDRRITAAEVELFCQTLGLSPHEKVLDLCCGQGRHSLELARRAFGKVEGIRPVPLPHTKG